MERDMTAIWRVFDRLLDAGDEERRVGSVGRGYLRLLPQHGRLEALPVVVKPDRLRSPARRW